MKNLILICTILSVSSLFAQEKKLWVENKELILQGVVSFESAPELFVGQEYLFTIIANQTTFDLEIQSENLTVRLVEESKKRPVD